MEAAKCLRCIPAGFQWGATIHLLCQWANAPSQACQSAFLSYPTNLLRNNFTGTVGFVFSVLNQITVSRLGRVFTPGSTQNHDVKLWRDPAAALIASGTVVCPTPIAVNTVAWVDVAPTILTPGTFYRIASNETNGGDTWKDEWKMAAFIDGSVFSPVSSCYGVAPGVYPNFTATAQWCYGNPDMCFILSAPPPLISDWIFMDEDGAFWKLIVSPDGNLGLETNPGPASPDLILQDDGVGMWKFRAATDGTLFTEPSAGPAIPAPVIDDGVLHFWQVGVSSDGNFWASF